MALTLTFSDHLDEQVARVAAAALRLLVVPQQGLGRRALMAEIPEPTKDANPPIPSLLALWNGFGGVRPS